MSNCQLYFSFSQCAHSLPKCISTSPEWSCSFILSQGAWLCRLKTQFHRFMCLLPPQTSTLCQLFHLTVQLRLLLIFDRRFNHCSAAFTLLANVFFLRFKQRLFIQWDCWGNWKYIVSALLFFFALSLPLLSADSEYLIIQSAVSLLSLTLKWNW